MASLAGMANLDPVSAQADAFNAHDLEAFVACYAPHVTVRSGDGEVVLDGIDAVRARYDEWFTRLPDLHAEIRGRLRVGDWVVDEERLTLRLGEVLRGLVAYHLAGDVIDAVILMMDD
jgi:hypothetical protein